MCVGALVACVPASSTSVAGIPTSVLLPATATFTPTPIVPTATPIMNTLVDPADLLQPATATPIAPLLASDVETDVELLRAILEDVAAFRNVDVGRVTLVSVEAAQWRDDTFDCDVPRNLTVREGVARFGGKMARDGLRVRVLVGSTLHEYHTVQQAFIRCETVARVSDDVLLMVDPVAMDMLNVVQRRVSNQLDLPLQRIRLISIAPYIWQDSSLGCPRPDQTYTEARIGGYRIVVAAGDSEYLYHTDSITAVPCEPALEVLPR